MFHIVAQLNTSTGTTAQLLTSQASVLAAHLHAHRTQEICLGTGGRHALCAFDIDQSNSPFDNPADTFENTMLWAATKHVVEAAADLTANVIVERTFDEAVLLENIQAIEDRGAWCLEAYNVTFVRTYFSEDRRRMICLYHAPDAESVRLAQRQAHMPFGDVWAFEQLAPVRD
jgi:hypothetical protein